MTYTTSDGYILTLQADGSWTDGDMIFNNTSELLDLTGAIEMVAELHFLEEWTKEDTLSVVWEYADRIFSELDPKLVDEYHDLVDEALSLSSVTDHHDLVKACLIKESNPCFASDLIDHDDAFMSQFNLEDEDTASKACSILMNLYNNSH